MAEMSRRGRISVGGIETSGGGEGGGEVGE